MTEPTTSLVSVGMIAKRLNVSPSMIVRWEKSGRIPAATRVEAGSLRRRVWTGDQVAAMEAALSKRQSAKEAPAAT